jgi:hypothetical protein
MPPPYYGVAATNNAGMLGNNRVPFLPPFGGTHEANIPPEDPNKKKTNAKKTPKKKPKKSDGKAGKGTAYTKAELWFLMDKIKEVLPIGKLLGIASRESTMRSSLGAQERGRICNESSRRWLICQCQLAIRTCQTIFALQKEHST